MVFGALIGASSDVNAVSPFDNTIQPVSEWSMTSGQNPSKTCDFSNNFPLLIDYTPTSSGSHNSTQDISGCSIRYNAVGGLSWQTVRDLWSDADSWVLYKNEPSQLFFFYLPAGTALYNFDLITNGSQLSLDSTFTNSVCGSNQSTSPCILISLNNSANLSGQDVSFNISRFTQTNNKPVPAMNISSNYIYKPYIFDGNYTINYPPNYEGVDVPVPTDPPAESPATPNFYVSISVDFLATIHDTNFNTIDNVPFLCSDDLVPVLHWEIYKVNSSLPDELLASGTQSASMQIQYQFPVATERRDYSIVGTYECGDSPIFIQSGVFNFAINQHGTLIDDWLAGCFLEVFPFVDVPRCVLNMERVINMLSFGTFALSSDWNYSSQCHTLTVLDEWIPTQDKQVCAYIPQNVRDTITPFITFFLGLVTMMFITRTRESNSG